MLTIVFVKSQVPILVAINILSTTETYLLRPSTVPMILVDVQTVTLVAGGIKTANIPISMGCTSAVMDATRVSNGEAFLEVAAISSLPK